MSLPKKLKKDLSIKRESYNGKAEWGNQFLDQNKTFLPRDIDLNDLDKGFIEFINTMVKHDIPTQFMSTQRWTEFAKGWQNTDKYKNIKIPFISLVRTAVEKGTNPVDFKIPVRKTFPYMKIPVWDGSKKGADIYKIPNPVGVDLTYDLHFLSFKMRELNDLHQIITEEFSSAQTYINMKGHYFPMLLEDIDNETITDITLKKYYKLTYKLKLQGYIVDSEEFEIVPAIDRVLVLTEVIEPSTKPIVRRVVVTEDDKKLTIKLILEFLPKANTELSFGSEDMLTVNSVDTENILEYILKVNNVVVNTPFKINKNDVIYLKITKDDTNEKGNIIFNGVVDR